MTKTVLITGAKGQLAQSIKNQTNYLTDIIFIFKTSEELDITDSKALAMHFSNNNFDYCVNCAAYTGVDKAEDEVKKAFDINAYGSQNLALACKQFNTTLIHISTDFVFDGKKNKSYTEQDTPKPINTYGASKLKGEEYISEILTNYFIIRTSWLYSEFGHNFVKTILRLSKEKQELKIVSDQIGSPTYAGDLASLIIKILLVDCKDYGLYHYANHGQTSWYGFASKILQLKHSTTKIKPQTSNDFKTRAKRPKYSVLNINKVIETFKIEILDWEISLAQNIEKMKG
ncbi:dTDP-4-dehydrorhamnose reductase [Winogradskyella poriferorum]|jgi:dTDP-4-dehydrorhamnose reductase|uniref:dTDP-4-dehydrorhamnose reductase n=1 Tax=Winogradskyella poriferorum TaxID=307627 RepID=UPI003D64AF59